MGLRTLCRLVPSLQLPYHLYRIAFFVGLIHLELLLRHRLNQASLLTRRPGRGIVLEAGESTCLEDLDVYRDERIVPPAQRRILCIRRKAGRSPPIFHVTQG